MASIVKRGKRYCVVYYYVTDKGERKQKWESGYSSKQDAHLRKCEVELGKAKGSFRPLTTITVEEFLLDWADTYAKCNWQFHTYTTAIGLIEKHINPQLGTVSLQKLTGRQIMEFLGKLRCGAEDQGVKALSATTVHHIFGLLKQALETAVVWKLLDENPAKMKAPKRSKVEQPILSADEVFYMMEHIHDPLLHLAVHLAFAGSLRIGELLGITLDCLNLTENGGTILIDKTLQRIKKNAYQRLPKGGVCFSFPNRAAKSGSLIVLKRPKTDASRRKIFLTAPLREEISKRLLQIQQERSFMGDTHAGYQMLFSGIEGWPIEPALCEKWFRKWQKENVTGYEPITFHGLRHSSATFKLLLSNGDYKSVQGDTGHASADMLLNLYAHIQVRPRLELMQKFEESFYLNSPKAEKV